MGAAAQTVGEEDPLLMQRKMRRQLIVIKMDGQTRSSRKVVATFWQIWRPMLFICFISASAFAANANDIHNPSSFSFLREPSDANSNPSSFSFLREASDANSNPSSISFVCKASKANSNPSPFSFLCEPSDANTNPSSFSFLREGSDANSNPSSFSFLREPSEANSNPSSFSFLREASEANSNPSSFSFLREASDANNNPSSFSFLREASDHDNVNNPSSFSFLREASKANNINNPPSFSFLRYNHKASDAAIIHNPSSFSFLLNNRKALVGTAASKIFNVESYGAKGDGVTDDQKAFLTTWAAACNDATSPKVLLVPAGKTYLVSPITFTGPCNGKLYFQIDGTVIAPSKISAYGGQGKHVDVSSSAKP